MAPTAKPLAAKGEGRGKAKAKADAKHVGSLGRSSLKSELTPVRYWNHLMELRGQVLRYCSASSSSQHNGIACVNRAWNDSWRAMKRELLTELFGGLRDYVTILPLPHVGLLQIQLDRLEAVVMGPWKGMTRQYLTLLFGGLRDYLARQEHHTVGSMPLLVADLEDVAM